MAQHRGTQLALITALALAGCQQGGSPAQEIVAQGTTPQGMTEGFPAVAMTDAAAPAVTEAGSMPPLLDTSRMQAAQIVDSNGFGQPMVAAELQIPAGWQAVGGVTWNDATNCIANQLQIGWSAIGPDSLTAVEILPGFNWQVAGTEIQMNPCPSAPYRSTREFLEATVQRTRPGARVLDYQDQPEIAQQMARAAQARPQANQQAQVRHDAGRLLIAYPKDGVDMREVLTATVSFSSMQGNVVGGTATISSIRAPNNRLDFDLGTRVLAGMRANPQWLDAMRQRSMANLQRVSNAQSSSINDWHNRQMAIINARGAADRAAIRMRTNQEVSGIYNAIAANTSATSDSMHKTTMSGVREVNNYAGVDGSTVQSSIHGGSQVFQDTANPANAYSTDAPYPSPPAGYVELEREQ
ncbi:hypothetical protein [Thermomonas carbonis]|uniref:Lipoprotein n=1 Tax=Thermomonas carbonis TaxID=1463158 RepID=A0A7G9STD5_9GAMM|nr:hypothetical protein [Thermomonas carbonis]QNN71110.1 hypothetical protein H9L16_05965 [Thermomonas carbonis]GHC12308.1 hypothetical protein GCM10010080_29930 [Thermomonas carbonis]